MTTESRRRLARIVQDPRCDLAEAALLCCVEVEPDLDVERELLRLDALADQLRADGFRPGSPRHNAATLTTHLARDHGFSGNAVEHHDPRNGLLTVVLDRKRGLPITLAIVYVAIGRRLGLRVFGINAPGHFLVGVGTAEGRHPASAPPAPEGTRDVVVLDPFHGGAILRPADIDERIRRATAGLAGYEPEVVRPTPPAAVVRRLLNNLTRDFLAVGDAEDALWTVELKRIIPGSGPDDVETLAELLVKIGRYRHAAETIEAYLSEGAPPHIELEDLEKLAVRARAKMN
jgi:regulator of sirC expression with transglutaminase-like and TPR domain